MTLNTTMMKTGSSAASQPPKKPQSRLILQEPIAFEQSIQPSLRSSAEIAAQPAAETLDREKAREIWENLSLESQDAEQRLSERKRLLQRAENLARESVLAKTQAADLQTQLAKAHEQRFHHPAVYAGAMGLLGLGGLWLLERRKRIQSQERELEMMAAQSPSLAFTERDRPTIERTESVSAYVPQRGSMFSLEDSPDLARDFATDLSGLPEPVNAAELSSGFDPLESSSTARLRSDQEPVVFLDVSSRKFLTNPIKLSTPSNNNIFDSETNEQLGKEIDLLPKPNWVRDEDLAASQTNAFERTPDEGLLAASKRMFSNILQSRKAQSEATASPSHFAALASVYPITGVPTPMKHIDSNDATQMLHSEDEQQAFEQALLAQQLSAGLHVSYSPDCANNELLSQTLMASQSGETAMEHLLELRTAVNGLCALGRPEGAAKLLEEHIALDSNTCAWGFLEYMHLCEQIGWREEFESMRKRYREQFNRMAPYWQEPNSNVLGLDGYARAAAELCTAWAQGVARSKNILSAWLVGPLLGRKLVQLPAYHDLCDLYEMLEFMDVSSDSPQTMAAAHATQAPSLNPGLLSASSLVTTAIPQSEQAFVPTVSLLDLDYEFSSDVTLQEKEVQQSEKSVTVVKTGNFSVDFNVAGTQMGALASLSADLPKR